ncbi:MAG: hypothetical protein IPK26_20900 [Planctomycetes bacterium]|nr:hypothetical protein [Planctomycetota bacterium]
MLALVIEDVTLIKQQQVTAAVRFRGGATTTLTLPRPLTAQQRRATHEAVRSEIDELLGEYTNAQVANILNQRGRRTGAGDAFTTSNVQWVRFSTKFKSLKQRMLDAGWLSPEDGLRHARHQSHNARRSSTRRPGQRPHLFRPRRLAVLAAGLTSKGLPPSVYRSTRHIHCERCIMRDDRSSPMPCAAATAAASAAC